MKGECKEIDPGVRDPSLMCGKDDTDALLPKGRSIRRTPIPVPIRVSHSKSSFFIRHKKLIMINDASIAYTLWSPTEQMAHSSSIVHDRMFALPSHC